MTNSTIPPKNSDKQMGKNTHLTQQHQQKEKIADTNNQPAKRNQNQEQKSTAAGKKNTAQSGYFRFTFHLFTLILIMVLASWLYYVYQQVEQQESRLQTFNSQSETVQQQLSDINLQQNKASKIKSEQLLGLQTQQQQYWKQLETDLETQNNQLRSLQHKIAALSASDNSQWLVAQAHFFINQAAYKLRHDGDIETAEMLLGSANKSIAEINGPLILKLRKTLAQDIAALAATTKVDADGISLKLNQLTELLDNLPPVTIDLTTGKAFNNTTEITDSITDWRQNLVNSWRRFLHDFINIKTKGDEVVSAELMADQRMYLRENIRLQLLIASQSVFRGQQAIYQQALTKVQDWLKNYSAPTNPVTKEFLDQLKSLANTDISRTVPIQLMSQQLMENMMKNPEQYSLSPYSANDLDVKEG